MAKEEVKDTGLGLSDFLATPTQKTEVTPVEEAKPEETPQEQTEEKPTEPEVKPEEKPAKEETPKEELPKEEPPKETKPTIDWDSDTNPFKQRHKDASKWANQVHMQNLELQKQMEIINKKLDGTYDAEAEAKAQEIPPHIISQTSEMAGKIVASRQAAFEIYGKDNVENLLWADNAPFRAIENDPMVQARVMSSMSPVLEAMKCVEEASFYSKWGKSPKDIEENIKKAYEKEIEDRVTKKILEKVNLKEKQVTGIGEARGAPGATPPDKNKIPPLVEVFGGR